MADTTKKILLYNAFQCPFCQRVRLALEYFKIPYTIHEIDIANKENQEEWYKKINPSGTVPALILQDGSIATESFPFVQRLDNENNNILSKQNGDNYDAAFNILNNQLGKAFFTFINLWKDKSQDFNDVAVKENYHQLIQILVNLANELKYENTYFFGSKEQPSLLDITFITNLYQFKQMSELILKKNIFESSENAEEDLKLKKLLNYINFVSQNIKEFQYVTFNPTRLPDEGNNFYFKENNIKDISQFKFEEFMQQAFNKKFNL